MPVPGPAPIRTVYVAGGTTLFRVALDELGDATQWDRIASLNNLTDPWLMSGQYALLIPPPISSAPVRSAGGNQ